MNIDSLNTLFIHELRDLYSAEKQVVEALPQMVSAASAPELRDAFEHHLKESREHITRLDTIFTKLNVPFNGVKCKGMEGIIAEGEEVVKSGGDPAAKDAALIAAAQRVEHYEMAAYGSVRTYADYLGYEETEDLLQETLDEEGDADEKLTKLATGGFLSGGINKKART